ncbi:Protein of unknown function DUF2371, TMEM200 family-containing protein [Strongyloides ratti]|uniref:Neurensin-1 n=1 Tax=Strongyloides ratti TaxID=34506 RepID=A0A090LJ72_STRRB|nr:Protein of unknown function DUF2371, TMEM200 family-containing protein [Strongyloides ratti]CEF67585.1 Protein of unknown function DUF2371, TMEM200 family-containing protein [Strongyloides ratti]
MLGARGVSLGLGKINLSDLNKIPTMDRGQVPRIKKKPKIKPQVRVKKYVDKEEEEEYNYEIRLNPQLMGKIPLRKPKKIDKNKKAYYWRLYYENNKKTLWTACRAVIFGVIIITLGIIMTGLGYFDKELAKVTVYNETTTSNITYIDNFRRIQFKSMQYIGPVLMGVGSFMLIIACVITLESRDKHTLIIQNEADKQRKILKDDDEKEKFVEVKETMFLNTKKYIQDKKLFNENDEKYIKNDEIINDDNISRLTCGNDLSINVEDLDDECFKPPEKCNIKTKRRATISCQYSKSMVDKTRVNRLKQDYISKKPTISSSTSFKRASNQKRRSIFNLQGKDQSVSTDDLAKQHLYENRDLYAELLEDFYKKYAVNNVKTVDENNLLPNTNLDDIIIHNVSSEKIQEEDPENN